MGLCLFFHVLNMNGVMGNFAKESELSQSQLISRSTPSLCSMKTLLSCEKTRISDKNRPENPSKSRETISVFLFRQNFYLSVFSVPFHPSVGVSIRVFVCPFILYYFVIVRIIDLVHHLPYYLRPLLMKIHQLRSTC